MTDDQKLDAAMVLASDLGRKADTIKTVLCALRLALCELDMLRPLHYGRDDSRGDRMAFVLDSTAEHFVKEELACLPLTVDALEKEWRSVTDEHEAACALVHKLDPPSQAD